MSDRVSKESSTNAKSLRKSRECFIEVYINNRWIIIIIYKDKHLVRVLILCKFFQPSVCNILAYWAIFNLQSKTFYDIDTSSCTHTSWANFIELFTAVTYEWAKNRESLSPGRPFRLNQPTVESSEASCVRPFYEQAVCDLDRSIHISLWV